MKRILLLVLFYCFFGLNMAHAQNLITPFGGIAWNDGFTSVVQKMLSLPGIEKCEARMGVQKIDLLKATSSVSLTEAATKLIIQGKLGRSLKTHIDNRTHKEWKYLSGEGPSISCSPVVIEGVPFTLTANFVCNPGVLLYEPQNVLFGPKDELYPLILRNVVLESKSPALKLKHTAISAVVSAKYLEGKIYEAGTITTRDRDDTALGVTAGPSHYRIDYGAAYGSGYYRRLNVLYAEYEAKLAVEQAKDKQNLSGGL